ncbi:Gfo/Idh/MocA family oxidoreductase [Candidatus Pristimantibacillus sp. PTI5]|uniref:Gfo/Idh/MocA family oxidoreductase n=1 Tax=Candidatus Pristimantibacillus sp. PTI5 TaxID=3400422 RepID=UPI003B014480
MTMQIGLQLITVKNTFAKNRLKTLKEIAKIGYQYIELPIEKNQPGAFNIDEMPANNLNNMLKESGLRVLGTHISIDNDSDIAALIAYNQEIESTRVVVPMTLFKNKEDVLSFSQRLNSYGKQFKENGIQLYYHNHFQEFQRFDNEFVLDVILASTNPEYVKIELDTYWAVRAGVDILSYIQKLGDRCGLIHQKDMPASMAPVNIFESINPNKEIDMTDFYPLFTEDSFSEIGQGVMDIQGIVKAAERWTKTEFVIVEQDVTARSELESITISYKALAKIMDIPPITPKPLHVGIVGTGEIAQVVHLPLLAAMSDKYKIAALCDVSQHSLQFNGEKYNVTNLYTDVKEMVKQEDLNVIFILNSDEYHAEAAIEAANAGKHVLIEKPMALTLSDADAIIEAEARNDVKIMVGYMRRYAPALEAAVKEIGGLDSINYVRVRAIVGPNPYFVRQSGTYPKKFSDFPESANEDRNARSAKQVEEAVGEKDQVKAVLYRMLTGLSSHDLSAMREAIGMPLAVAGVTLGLNSFFMNVLFNYDGFNVSFETGMDQQGRFDAHIEVYGSNKSVRVQYDSPYILGLPVKLIITETEGDSFKETVNYCAYKSPYIYELESFYEAITDHKPIKTTPEDYREDLELFKMVVDRYQPFQAPAGARKKKRGRKIVISDETKVGELLSIDEACIVLEKHRPGFTTNPMVGMAKGFTIKEIAGFPQTDMTGEEATAIMADLIALN